MQTLEPVFNYLKTLMKEFTFTDLMPLEGKYTIQTFPANSIIFKEGDLFTKVTFLIEGLVKKFYLTTEGKEFIKEFTLNGQITTPYASLLQNLPASYTMQALEPTKLFVIEYDLVNHLIQTNPRWSLLGKAFADMHFINRELREMELLKYPAIDRYKIFKKRFPHLLDRLKKQDIASYLGITPVSLSRLEQEL